MPEKLTYLLVDFFCIIFPFLFSFHPRIKFYKQWPYFWLPCTLTALLFIVWDIGFTRLGVWGFNPRYLIGVYLFHLPLEEYLFFLCIPYACVFTYYCISNFFPRLGYKKLANYFSILLIIVLSVVALFNPLRLYTSVTFLLLAITLTILLVKYNSFLAGFYISFLIILLPFFISNGILTGSVTEEPVVYYNFLFNLGIRLFTIPLEDVFYGMTMLILNIAGFEYVRNKHSFVATPVKNQGK